MNTSFQTHLRCSSYALNPTDTVVGGGKIAKPGMRLQMKYTGRLASNNKVFDSSGNRPFSFSLGRREVIAGMCCDVQAYLAKVIAPHHASMP